MDRSHIKALCDRRVLPRVLVPWFLPCMLFVAETETALLLPGRVALIADTALALGMLGSDDAALAFSATGSAFCAACWSLKRAAISTAVR